MSGITRIYALPLNDDIRDGIISVIFRNHQLAQLYCIWCMAVQESIHVIASYTRSSAPIAEQLLLGQSAKRPTTLDPKAMDYSSPSTVVASGLL